MSCTEPPRAKPVQYHARLGTRWEKEKASAGAGAFDFPEDPKEIGPWIIGECVGKGASGRVKIARHSLTGQLAAVKILPLEAVISSRVSLRTKENKSERHRNGIDKEIIMMKLMDHPNIIRIYDVFEGEKELFLVLEYVEGGELFDYLVNNGRMEPIKGLAYFKQIIYGLSYAHAFSIIHRDLKPENILIHSLNPPAIKIADWGMAAFAPPAHTLETSCGSPHYASPEIVNGKKYEGTATDIWSCGVILFALMTGRLPFDDKNMKTLLGKVKAGKYDMPSYVHAEAADLIRRMLVVDVDKRIAMSEILAHPFLKHETPGITYVPAPTISELARPIRSAGYIQPDLFRSLQLIWGHVSTEEELTADLLSPPGEGSLVKALYFLLVKHRNQTLENFGMFTRASGGNGSMGDSKLLMSPNSKLKYYLAPPPLKVVKKKQSRPRYRETRSESCSRPDRAAPPIQVTSRRRIGSPARTESSRGRPSSPVGPRPPHNVHSQHPHIQKTQSVETQRSRPVSSPPAQMWNNAATTTHPQPTPIPIPGHNQRPYVPQRGKTIDGLPMVAGTRFGAMKTRVHSGSHNPRGREGEPMVAMSLPAQSQMTGMSASPQGPTISPRPKQVVTFIRAPASPPNGGHQKVKSHDREDGIGNETGSQDWPHIRAPRVDNPELQRTIDEVAGRFNVLVERDRLRYGHGSGTESVQPVAEAANAGGVGESPTPRILQQPTPYDDTYFQTPPRHRDEIRVRNPNHVVGMYSHPNEGSEYLVSTKAADDHSNKENVKPIFDSPVFVPSPRRGSSGKLEFSVDESSHGFEVEGKRGIKRAGRPPALDLHNSNKQPTVPGSPYRSNGLASPLMGLMSPVLSPPVAVVGEFKGWFSNLFNWKAQQYTLYSVDNCHATRQEALRLLEKFGVVMLVDEGAGSLKCRVEDGYDTAASPVPLKPVRFRIEFNPVIGYNIPLGHSVRRIHQSGAGADAGFFVEDCATPKMREAATFTGRDVTPYVSTVVLVQEKGALSTFRRVYYRLRAEWSLDALRSPDAGAGAGLMVGSATPQVGSSR